MKHIAKISMASVLAGVMVFFAWSGACAADLIAESRAIVSQYKVETTIKATSWILNSKYI